MLLERDPLRFERLPAPDAAAAAAAEGIGALRADKETDLRFERNKKSGFCGGRGHNPKTVKTSG